VHVSQDENGNEPGWPQPHGVDNALIWGPEGWCEAQDPKHKWVAGVLPSPLPAATLHASAAAYATFFKRRCCFIGSQPMVPKATHIGFNTATSAVT
jgi:hypothetical protein